MAERVVDKLAAKGLLSGKTESAFAPDERITRRNFASLLVKGLGLTG
ncbi:S-layer homology domain-containing protein [Cohnella faecalis]